MLLRAVGRRAALLPATTSSSSDLTLQPLQWYCSYGCITRCALALGMINDNYGLLPMTAALACLRAACMLELKAKNKALPSALPDASCDSRLIQLH